MELCRLRTSAQPPQPQPFPNSDAERETLRRAVPEADPLASLYSVLRTGESGLSPEQAPQPDKLGA
ncbi:uncharacterized protein N7458_006588 [Penicillium daleae]|uniref:Uncharacterized protein n=1 Tax=Penicillium daleae TaxID=63821 RepID=A0AAD6C512_9EURO|nr:uncharacterized protein N7458_006588 [Penicillium daleae]KAJ5450139.1 hypothetical protein N7458_006588 [Penicillium daleae]